MRLDESPDDKFYDTPRMGPHADEKFELALTGASSSTMHYALLLGYKLKPG